MVGVWWTSQRKTRFSSCRNVNGGERRDGNCEGKLGPDDQVANEDKRSIGSVGNGSGNVPHDNRLSKMLRRILNTKWGDGGVPAGIGTYPIDNMCLVDLFLVRRCSVRRL